MNSIRCFSLLVATLALSLPQLAGATQLRDFYRVEVDVDGGSLIVGTPRTDELAFVSAFGLLQVPIASIESLDSNGDGETFTLRLRNGDVVGGAPEQRALAVQTVMGTVEVPLQHLLGANFTAPTLFEGHAYMPVDTAMSWREAREHASRLGGHLVVIGGAAENQFVTEMMASRTHDHCWIGYSDETEEGRFRWVDGSRSTFVNWSSAEPNNAGTLEHYAHLYTSGSLVGLWNDWSADVKLPFVVELEFS
jgi:hypothetical protein